LNAQHGGDSFVPRFFYVRAFMKETQPSLPSFDGETPDDWRRHASSGDATSDVVLRKEFITEVETGADDRTIKFIISTGSADREKDVINPNGWDTGNYLKNPVVLFAHDYNSLPVARTTSLTQQGDTLIAEAEFADEALNPAAEQVYQMLRQGYLRGASVGFRPLTFQYNEERGGVDFEKQELLEFSVVPVPANPGALMSAGVGAAGDQLIRGWAKKVLEGHTETKAPVRDQLDDFLDVMRKAMNDIKGSVREAIKNVDDFQNTFQYMAVNGDNKSVEAKGVTPPNPSGFGEAPMEERWEKPTLEDFADEGWGELSDAQKRSIATHFAWSASRVPENYGDLKLPHHNADGDVVWRGVASAAAYLDSTQIPGADVGGVRRHLANHYRQFDREAPWEKDGAGWSAYCKARTKAELKTGGPLPIEDVARLMDDFGFVDEAVILISKAPEANSGGAVAAPSPSPETASDALQPVLSALDGLSAKLDVLASVPTTPAPSDMFIELDDGDDDVVIDLDSEDMTKAVREGLGDSLTDVVGSEVRAAFNALRGRID
jgi:HK97 family phage prohead protease